MLTLGIAGGLDPVHDQVLDSPQNYTFDGAAVLVRDGRIVAAAEEERLNRIKHSNKFPVEAIRYCLREAGARPEDVDRYAYYVDEGAADTLLRGVYLAAPDWPDRAGARTLLARTLSGTLGVEIPGERIAFYPHKLTHAASALAHSGYDTALVHVVDSAGGVFDGSRDAAGRLRLEERAAFEPSRSLNTLWERTLPYLGFGLFDEHRAMALAAHGDPSTFAELFTGLYTLRDEGDYGLDLRALSRLAAHVEPRRRQDPPQRVHHDIAAALQHATEEIVLHVLRHHRRAGGHARLCMAGGMIENVALSGRVLRSGLFDEVFVHPAAYDSGCAVGAALLAADEGGDRLPRERVPDVYWGTPLDPEEVEAALAGWAGFLTVERPASVTDHAADLLAEGLLVGWVQGRAEFGSHALGNRSILADPRRAENLQRVGGATGRDEPYRALSASVPAAHAADWFDVPAGAASASFMTFSVAVRADRREALPAVVHADGSTRLHVADPAANPRLAALLDAVGERTGVPVLLNTSFKGAGDPAVDSAHDAVVSFLTGGLDRLVIGDAVVARAEPAERDWAALEVSVAPYVKVFRVRGQTERDQGTSRQELRTTYDPPQRRPVPARVADLLDRLDRPRPVGEAVGEGPDRAELLDEVRALWGERLVRLAPAATPTATQTARTAEVAR